MSYLYAMLTRHCNLSCPHCDVKNDSDDGWNKEAFLSELNSFDGYVNIFGGEPSLYVDRLKAAAPYARGVSTNLLNLTKDVKQIYDLLDIATSWNVQRFTDEQYHQWIRNVESLNRKPALLITLTPDLTADTSYFDFFKAELDGRFSDIRFEQLLDPSKNERYYEHVDDWLCKLYKFWQKNMKTPCPTFESDWYFNCDGTYTLYPDGHMKYGCPEAVKVYVPEKCYSCHLAAHCRPCPLQRHCTRPKRLMELVKNERTEP